MAGLYTAIKIILKYKKKPTILIQCINIVGLFGGGPIKITRYRYDFNVFSIYSAVFMRFFNHNTSPETSSFFSHCTSLKCAYQAFQSHHDASGHIRLRRCPL